VFNFAVADWHTYFVGVWAWLVHNAGRCVSAFVKKIIAKDLPEVVQSNLKRFAKKIPANSKTTIEIFDMGDGTYKFAATSVGKVPGSKAIYEKLVDASGKTISYIKTTIAPDGTIVHIKNKM
jgi:hypothetical protein